MTIEDQANCILYDCGLLEELSKYGTPHIIGSYRMDMMAWNDLDIDIENENMSLDKLYRLSQFVIDKFHPIWYEAKEEINSENKTVWFQGFEAFIENELWNVDLWFFDKDTIKSAEEYCDKIVTQVKESPESKEQIIRLKKELIVRKLYAFDQYTSIDVYNAVLNQHIVDIENFLTNYVRA
ncbi:hypothetical protein [Parablautia muri]|uniref:Uncharacterized protein n=1 Tax=Parablautia muri TaxID=2320879 RepID=A0A9X5GR75_9FIRM|nr:hypothetical protein [Parablautia muri]NBJ92933.1 hypothetical protein [Parablautia muri]